MVGDVVGFVFGVLGDVEDGFVFDVVRLIFPIMFGFGCGFMFMGIMNVGNI